MVLIQIFKKVNLVREGTFWALQGWSASVCWFGSWRENTTTTKIVIFNQILNENQCICIKCVGHLTFDVGRMFEIRKAELWINM